METAKQVVMEALITKTTELLRRCSEPQVTLFHRLFPGGLDVQPEEKLRTAFDLVQRTVRKNEADLLRLAQ